MSKVDLSPREGLYPLPIIMVSCIGRSTDRPNIITIAWCGVVCSNPPQIAVSIRPSRMSYNLINDAGNFVINIPSIDLLHRVDACGIVSGRDTDKFDKFGFTPIASLKIASPAIKECPVNIECVLKNSLDLGTHRMFIGEVVNLRVDKEALHANGQIDFTKVKPFVYSGGEYWSLGAKIGYYGFSKK